MSFGINVTKEVKCGHGREQGVSGSHDSIFPNNQKGSGSCKKKKKN